MSYYLIDDATDTMRYMLCNKVCLSNISYVANGGFLSDSTHAFFLCGVELPPTETITANPALLLLRMMYTNNTLYVYGNRSQGFSNVNTSVANDTSAIYCGYLIFLTILKPMIFPIFTRKGFVLTIR